MSTTSTGELPPGSVAWRVAAVGVGLAVLLGGQLADTNDWFPLGSLSQYATPRSADGSVVMTSLEGTTVDGEVVQVPLSPRSIGMSRAEVESQGQRIVADPQLLGVLARSRQQLHPGAAPLRELRLVRSEHQLHDARVVGPAAVRVLATWTAP
ncbi:hypothetical protein [Kineococcus aurantiacus]|uniref:Uncharacterized protein n=1 Tax=Kineococcus aurantiacus TaxID=37633 RepID=A0A7Y9DLH3_9ACTN|nr:hypothetical protein [Kineococcus aurantiacus]NYD22798.1 hypothetical protein [Kineococcus aurantiacus]